MSLIDDLLAESEVFAYYGFPEKIREPLGQVLALPESEERTRAQRRLEELIGGAKSTYVPRPGTPVDDDDIGCGTQMIDVE